MLTSGLLSAAALALAAASAAGAQIAPGSLLRISGTADATDVGTPGVLLSFAKPVLAAGAGNTGAFAFLNAAKQPASVKLADVRVGYGPQAIKTFLKVGAYTFTLAALPSGPYGQDACYVYPEAGQRCTPYQSAVGNPQPATDGLSPFYLENTASGDPDAPFNSVAAFTLLGTVSGPGHTGASFVGTISTVFTGLSYQEALGGLEQYGLTGIGFTGTFVTGPAISRSAGAAGAASVVPEPSTFVLLAAGLAGAAGAARRRQRPSA